MTAREAERIAVLEQRVSDMADQLVENTKDTKAIRETLDNLTGGKQALMWITGIAISIAALVIAFIKLVKSS